MSCSRQLHHIIRRQKGVALIYVLLIFSMITIIASKVMTSIFSHTEKSALYIDRIQAKHYAMSAEQYVSHLLEMDFKENAEKKRQVDHEKQAWNIKGLDYDLGQGSIELTVVDAQGRFNINWLSIRGSEGDKYLKMFQNLLLTQSLDIEIANRIRLWFGASPDALGTAADNEYLMLTPPRRSGNTEMVSVSELNLVQGITPDIYYQLVPLLSALPKKTKLNLNTALPDVIRSISDKITENDALKVVEGRGENGFSKMEEIKASLEFDEKMTEINKAPVGFTSQNFTAYIAATYGEISFYLKTHLTRSLSGNVRVAGREIGLNSYWLTSD
ncbi:MAG: type II secretion system minor pseudopilin GspK [Endozoicomonas sp. (ex Botrylloides leachii)]|nr:type II secretion system minor pseudopilin GspK [Endozoicomonas sp. (ex Botrylloides leachii)]